MPSWTSSTCQAMDRSTKGHGSKAAKFASELIKSYPNPYFILNTRPINDWIHSRLNHVGGDFIEQYRLEKLQHNSQNLSDEEIILEWRYQWHKCHAEILSLFSNNPSLNSLIFDIKTSSYSTLKTFLSKDYSLFGETMPWVGKTASDNSPTESINQKPSRNLIKTTFNKIFSPKT